MLTVVNAVYGGGEHDEYDSETLMDMKVVTVVVVMMTIVMMTSTATIVWTLIGHSRPKIRDNGNDSDEAYVMIMNLFTATTPLLWRLTLTVSVSSLLRQSMLRLLRLL